MITLAVSVVIVNHIAGYIFADAITRWRNRPMITGKPRLPTGAYR